MADPVPPPPPPPPGAPDPLDRGARSDAENEREDPARLRQEAEKLKLDNKALQTQVNELRALNAGSEDGSKDLQRLHLLQIQPIRDVLVILLLLGVFWLGYILRPITVPMLLALTLAYLVEPVVRRIVEGRWMTRPQAAASVILIFLVVLTVPLAVGTTVAVSQGLQARVRMEERISLVRRLVQDPDNETIQKDLRSKGKAWLWIGKTVAGFANPQPTEAESEASPPSDDPKEEEPENAEARPPPPPQPPVTPDPDDPASRLSTVPPADAPSSAGEPQTLRGRASDWATETLEANLQGIGRMVARYLVGTGASALEIGLRTASIVAYMLFATFLVLFFFYFFCTGYERVTTSFANMIPKWKRERTLSLLRQMDAVIAAFVRGRLIIMGILMVMFTIGFWLIGVPGPLVVGPITGILAVVPYLGLISIPAAMLLMWLQPVGPEWQQTWWWILLAPVVLYFLIQTIEDYILTPQIQGKATDMDVPTILFAVLAGGILAGFYGVLLAIPAAACLKILLRESFWPRFKAWGEGKVKDFLPISRYDPTETGPSEPANGKNSSR
jgi:predicted PurR-regulated permease PerM